MAGISQKEKNALLQTNYRQAKKKSIDQQYESKEVISHYISRKKLFLITKPTQEK
jgi:hypothetical protein